jgi:predicted nucleic acid-binding Zn ribbon protein
MKAQAIAKLIIADRHRDQVARTDITRCFMCGYGLVYRGKRFCSDRCRNYYDQGSPGDFQDWLRPKIVHRWRDGRPMQMGPHGFLIKCAHCHKQFDSKGLRCCSTECERSYRERKDNLAVMAEVGIEAAPKRQCETCGTKIPKWRKGRKVSSKTRFCSPKCAKRLRDTGNREIVANT